MVEAQTLTSIKNIVSATVAVQSHSGHADDAQQQYLHLDDK